jgi:hypothetical protein
MKPSTGRFIRRVRRDRRARAGEATRDAMLATVCDARAVF